MIKTVACVKTTGEHVFVLRTLTANELIAQGYQADAVVYFVRRPSVGNKGLFHYPETFTSDELESVEDNLKREINEMVLKAKMQQDELKKARKSEEPQDATSFEIN